MTTVVHADMKTGRLVRTVVMEPGAAAPAPVLKDRALAQMIDSIAGEQGVENHLVHSVIRAESNYNTNAVSPRGAQGIMQLIPATARRFGVLDTFDPRQNIQGGVRYLRFLLDYYQGSYPKAIAAYNAGESAVDKYNGIPPFAETRNYVYQVARNLQAARQAHEADVVNPAVAPVAGLNNETARPVLTSTGSDGRLYYRTP